MDKKVLAQVLAKLHFSATLPEEVLTHMASAAGVHKFPAGTALFRENVENHHLLIIVTGRVALDMHVPERGTVRILSLGPGDVLAWSALLAAGRMTTSAVALEDTQVVSISAEELLSACEANHSFGYFLMRQVAFALAERLVATRRQLLDLFSFEQATGVHLTSDK
jgi:CRP/FNR family cyclic AMP-dependent transcriptional regulator